MRWPPGPRRRRPRSRRLGLDEHEQQPVEQPGRGVVQLPDGDGVHAAPTGDEPQLGEERPPGRDEHRDAGPERDPLPPHPLAEQRREVDGLRLGVVPRRARSRRGSARAPRRAAGPCRGRPRARPPGRWPGGRARRRGSRRSAGGRPRSAGRSSRRRRPGRRWRRCGASATRRSSARRSNRRCPPSVVNAGTRPSSAQRRSVSGSTPSSRLAWPSDSRSAGGRSGRDRASGTSPPCPGRHRARSGWSRNLGKPRSLHANVGGRSVGTPGIARQMIGERDPAALGPASAPTRPGVRRARTRGRRGGCRRTGPRPADRAAARSGA